MHCVYVCTSGSTTAVLSLIGATSVTSFYIVVVLGLASLSKTFFARPLNMVADDEMPQPDELIELCKGIHTLRAQGKLKDEMQMFKVGKVFPKKHMTCLSSILAFVSKQDHVQFMFCRVQVLLRICRSQESLLRITGTKWDTIPASSKMAEEDRRHKLKQD